jgi:hypothetical protein
MPRLRNALTIVAALMLIASSGAHSLLGWPALRDGLRAASALADLIAGLGMGWRFAGIAMLAFGLIALWTVRASRGGQSSVRFPVAVMAGAYLAFGFGSAVLLGWDPSQLLFLVPGAVLALAAAVPSRVAP